MTNNDFLKMSRRELLRLGGSALVVSAATGLGAETASGQQRATFCGEGVIPIGDEQIGIGAGSEPMPLSPLIVDAFRENLPVPSALAPTPYTFNYWEDVAPGKYQQNCDGGTHQLWCQDVDSRVSATPNLYRLALQVAPHRITEGRVQALQYVDGGYGTVDTVVDTDLKGVGRKVRRVGSLLRLPHSTITGFSGTPDIPHSATFPGPLINADYWKPNVVRFINQLGDDGGLDMGDFGDPERGFLTHLHNAHTACESDGNPNDTHRQYLPGEWVDNLYLNYPAGGDTREMQTFLWFHDHTHKHTSANVYKGMVGLYPIYDPRLDSGHERKEIGLRLPGLRRPRTDGAFDVLYDIPLALYDCLLDDGVTPHQDWHNGCGEVHAEWWGKLFFRHYPNHGFVGDVFTVNGKAYPKFVVRRRRYRLRFLNASVARIYKLAIMRRRAGQTVQAVPGLQGQYSFGYVKPDGKFERELGEPCMRPRQIASEGGLLLLPFDCENFELWPANRKEFVVDFGKYLDGSDTKDGDEFYLVNLMKMKNGRKPNTEGFDDDTGQIDPEYDPRYCVPLMKFVVNGAPVVDDSIMPPLDRQLRPLPPMPRNWYEAPTRTFELDRSSKSAGESDWVINGEPWNPRHVMAKPKLGAAEIWILRNNSGGWVHPMHLHMEEHRTLFIKEAGSGKNLPLHRDQPSKEDVANLGPNEEHWVFRRFRTFTGSYVSHCHNLAHEDHSMMFGWEIEE